MDERIMTVRETILRGVGVIPTKQITRLLDNYSKHLHIGIIYMYWKIVSAPKQTAQFATTARLRHVHTDGVEIYIYTPGNNLWHLVKGSPHDRV